MYDFAIVALLALAAVKVVDFLTDQVDRIRTMRSLLTLVASIGAALALDYSIFDAYGVAVRDHNVGIWITGCMVAGLTVPWRAVFSYLTHDRADRDETLGEHRPGVRAA